MSRAAVLALLAWLVLPTAPEIRPQDAAVEARRARARQETDQKVLAKIAGTDPEPAVRWEAAMKINDAAVLQLLAMQEPSLWVAQALVGRLTSADALLAIARAAAHPSARYAAVVRLTDQRALTDIATTDPAPGVRDAALRRIDDPDVIARIAMSDAEEQNQLTALDRLTEQEHVARVARGSAHPRVRLRAVSRLDDNVRIAEAAAAEPDPATRQRILDLPVRITGTLTNSNGVPFRKNLIYLFRCDAAGGIQTQYRNGVISDLSTTTDNGGRFTFEVDPARFPETTVTIGWSEYRDVFVATRFADGRVLTFRFDRATKRVNLGTIVVGR